MNKILTFLLLIFSFSLSAQSISGKAFYKSKTTSGTDYSEMPEEKRTRLEKRDKELYEKTYILTFNNKESFYKEEESLDSNSSYGYRDGFLAATGSYFSNGIYKNIESDSIVEQREFLGKLFLVENSLPGIDWKLENESKQIGDYTVFKATAIQKVELNDYRMVNARDDKDANLIVTAWYTPQIPVNIGPDIYNGLPGLILELNIYRTTFLCSKIILNTRNSQEIKKPRNGQRVSINEFDQIAEKRRKEDRQEFIKN